MNHSGGVTVCPSTGSITNCPPLAQCSLATPKYAYSVTNQPLLTRSFHLFIEFMDNQTGFLGSLAAVCQKTRD